MEYTDTFIYVTSKRVAIVDNTFTINLGYNQDRPPYTIVEVLSATLQADPAMGSPVTNYVLKCQEGGINYSAMDNKGTALCLIGYSTDLIAPAVAPTTYGAVLHRNYEQVGYGSKVVFGNARSLTFYVEDCIGADKKTIGVGEINCIMLMLKVSYPKVGEIQPLYRSQIPL